MENEILKQAINETTLTVDVSKWKAVTLIINLVFRKWIYLYPISNITKENVFFSEVVIFVTILRVIWWCMK